MTTLRILDPALPADLATLDQLRADSGIEFVDMWAAQHEALRTLRPSPGPALLDEPARWVYYPWRRSVVRILGPNGFRAVRLDRNRNLVTDREQDVLTGLRIGVVGLSVGHVIAHTLATQGLCGELRLADFDELELSNLNRVPAGIFDLGVNKATVAARRIAEIDPYVDVRPYTSGLTADTVDEFLDGIDILVEECDSLDIKVMVRSAARQRRIPVLMATSDRGLIDVERFDLEPDRAIIHGLLGDVDPAELRGLDATAKIGKVLRMVDAGTLSARGAASLVEVGSTLSTWPQLAGDVALGATACAEAVRRIGLGEDLSSGRVRIDVAKALDELVDPATDIDDGPPAVQPARLAVAELDATTAGRVAAAASRAPSGGNAQPWVIEKHRDAVSLRIAPEHTSMMDVEFRGSAVALGAALFNARVAAAADGMLGAVDIGEHREGSPLRSTVHLRPGTDAELAPLYEPMLRRATNRHGGLSKSLPIGTANSLRKTAQRHGARLHLITADSEMHTAAEILADTDRVRYLTPRLHSEMVSELRWPGDASPDTGIDVHSLELDPGALLALDILRRGDVMSHLAEWGAGARLGADTMEKIRGSAALAVVTVDGRGLLDYARGGAAVEALWIEAQQAGLAVQPVSPVFLYAHNEFDLRKLSPGFTPPLQRLQRDFRALARTGEHESQVLVLRLCYAPPASTRSRRSDDRVRAPLGC